MADKGKSDKEIGASQEGLANTPEKVFALSHMKTLNIPFKGEHWMNYAEGLDWQKKALVKRAVSQYYDLEQGTKTDFYESSVNFVKKWGETGALGLMDAIDNTYKFIQFDGLFVTASGVIDKLKGTSEDKVENYLSGKGKFTGEEKLESDEEKASSRIRKLAVAWYDGGRFFSDRRVKPGTSEIDIKGQVPDAREGLESWDNWNIILKLVKSSKVRNEIEKLKTERGLIPKAKMRH